MSIMNDFEHLKIQLQDVRSATNDFGDKPIGVGGFGKVYRGELSFPEGSCMVAFKRLDRKFGQGDTEFWKEIMMLSQYRHENLISLLRFCHEGPERILVYEYASRGSLDRYLSDPCLTWTQRLKICLGAAHGLNYLHDPMNTWERVLHRDVKSSNILLNEKWTAKLSDFGLSKYGPANQKYTYLVSNVVGTPGYCDPLYWETGFLSKESDVYSFGVVLFEVMCGRLCFESCNGEFCILVPRWKKSYDENKLDDIICHHLKEQVDPDSLITFSSIANQCLNKDCKDRPTMAMIIRKLEMALNEQEMYVDVEERMKYEELIKIAEQMSMPLQKEKAKIAISKRSRKQLQLLFSKGVHIDDKVLYLNKDGKIREHINGGSCMLKYRSPGLWPHQRETYEPRFSTPSFSLNSQFQLDLHPRLLSPHITYTINLLYVFTYYGSSRSLPCHVPLKYKLDKDAKYSTSCVTQIRDGYQVTELYQFTSHQNQHDFKIQFLNQPYKDRKYSFNLCNVEFRPTDYGENEILENKNNVDLDIECEHRLTSDYVEIIKSSKYSMKWTTKKELYYILHHGLLINNNGEKWFSISKSMKKRYMQPWREILQEESLWKYLTKKESWIYKPLPESRFDMVAECCDIKSFTFGFKVESHLLSDETTYACYLVYKLPQEHKAFEDVVQLDFTHLPSPKKFQGHIYLLTPPHTPIIGLDVDQESHIPLQTRKIKGHPKLRKDGWMEIQMWEFNTQTASETISFHCCLSSCSKEKLTGLLVQGIEFRPTKVLFYYF